MAFLEWRRFSFFDVQNNSDNGKIAECLQDTNVAIATSGNAHLVLCDSMGWAHLFSRSWEVTSFKVYDHNVYLALQLPHDPYLVTVGDEEAGANSVIKVWQWARRDRRGTPLASGAAPALPAHMRPVTPTALAVADNKCMMAVGFQDGSVVLYNGDISRNKFKMKTLPDTGTSPITGLAFQGGDYLFVASRASVSVVQVRGLRRVALHPLGAAPRCSLLANEHIFTVATADAIYCYTVEGRGPCYALQGQKVCLDSFANYLIITTNETNDQATSGEAVEKTHHITILDVQNKVIVFSNSFTEVEAVITEWGSVYVLTKDKQLIHLEEKDLQTKLSVLFKKNLYDVAIRLASAQQYDVEGLKEIYKQYGDHLYNKGDLKGAIDQYIKTIGWLETSYVIRKYLESRHLEALILYLEELHKRSEATEDHTTLLLTCYLKLDQHDQHGKLKEFINSKDKVIDFDLDIAIKVVRQVSVDDAIALSANKKRHDWYLKMVVIDKKDYKQALEYISDLEFDHADMYMKRYGYKLVQHEPEESMKLLKLLCTDYKPRNKLLVDEKSLEGHFVEPDRALADDYIHMFLGDATRLIQFLEHVTKAHTNCSALVYNTLIEHYIRAWSTSSEKSEYEIKVTKLMKNPDIDYDKDQALMICQMLGFEAGTLILYEEKKLWRAAVRASFGSECARAEACSRGGRGLWLDALRATPPPRALSALLDRIESEKSVSPMQVLECLASAPSYNLGDVRSYLVGVLRREAEVCSRERGVAAKCRAESAAGREAARAARHSALTFQGSKCAACSRPLDLPTVHFLCLHSYHQHCFQSYADSDRECPACAEGGAAKAGPSVAPPTADQLHTRLRTDPDPYAVVAEYFGRSLFNKVTVVGGPQESVEAGPAAEKAGPTEQMPPTEARIRMTEGQSKQLYVANAARQVPPRGAPVIPVPEGCMRQLEKQHYSSSLEANVTLLQPEIHRPNDVPSREKRPGMQPIGQAPAADNPFEDYDSSKNPFAEDEVDGPSNPFSDGEDYDKNLNPFA